jgi:hypothetical protein
MTVPDPFDIQGAQITMSAKTASSTRSTSSSKITGLGDQVASLSSKVGNLYIDGCEKSIDTVVSLQRKVAAQSKIERVQTVVDAQADLVSGVGEATVNASRKIIA